MTLTDAAPARQHASAPFPRHVAIVLSQLTGGGAERVASSLASRWLEEGRAVTVVTLAAPDPAAYPLPPGVERVALGLAGASRNRLAGLFRALGRVRALRGALRGRAPGAVVAFGDRTNVLAIVATLFTGIPTYVSERTDPRAARNGWHWRFLRRLLYPLATAVVVQTESVAEWARARFRRVAVIPNFVSRPRLQASPGTDEGPRTLLALGRLERVKGFDLLCDAFARVAPGHPSWSLAIVGEGAERPALTALVRRLGLEGRVTLPGRATDPGPALAAAHAFVLSSRREGFPNALLEAMAAGLPAVAFDCRSGPSEIVTHGEDGLLVAAGDVAALAAALERMMADAAGRARMGSAASAVASRFSPDRVMERWAELLRGDRLR